MPTSPIRGTRGGAATGHDTGPIRDKHSGSHYLPTSPIKGTRGGAATGRNTGPIRGKHSGRHYMPTSPIRGTSGGTATGCDTGGVSTVEEARSPRKRGAADQLIGTRKAAKTMQGSAFEHVKRKPKKSRILGADPVSVEFVTCPTRGVFKGIDGVESVLRNKYLRVDPLAQYDIRSDNKDSSDESNHQAKHGTNSSQ